MEDEKLVYLFIGIIVAALIFSMIRFGGYTMMGRTSYPFMYSYSMMGFGGYWFMTILGVLIIIILILIILILIRQLNQRPRRTNQ